MTPPAFQWLSPPRGLGRDVSDVIVENCTQGCVPTEILGPTAFAQLLTIVGTAAAGASNPVTAAAAIAAASGLPAVTAGCIAQCMWITPECFVPSVCKQMSQKYPDQVAPELIEQYCDYTPTQQAQVDALCNRIYREKELPPPPPPPPALNCAVKPNSHREGSGSQAFCVCDQGYVESFPPGQCVEVTNGEPPPPPVAVASASRRGTSPVAVALALTAIVGGAALALTRLT